MADDDQATPRTAAPIALQKRPKSVCALTLWPPRRKMWRGRSIFPVMAPARFIGSLGTAAVIFTATPHLGSCTGEEDAFAARAHSVEGRISDGLARHAGLLRSRPKAPTPAETPKVTSPRRTSIGPKSPPGRRYEERSPSPWMIANALRDAEATQ
jgi:hypothetical protein